MKSNLNKEGGQALLVVVLVMVVALTVGLSLTSRSIINIRTSSEEADSQKALAAAEAGIERALQATSSAKIAGPSFSENNATYNANVTEVKGTAFLANGGNLALQDDGVDIWLVSHNVDGTADYANPWTGSALNIYWGDPSLGDDCKNAAIEVGIILGPKATASLKRYAYDPCTSRSASNKFDDTMSSGDYSVEGKKFKYKAELKNISSGLVARIVPIYASTAIAVDSAISLPSQGFAIDSTGTSGTGDRQVLRSITFFKTYDQLAQPYFMYGLFSP